MIPLDDPTWLGRSIFANGTLYWVHWQCVDLQCTKLALLGATPFVWSAIPRNTNFAFEAFVCSYCHRPLKEGPPDA